MSRAVIRVFFSTGLYKTAAIDDTVNVMELCRMIARKVKIEKGVEGVGNCTLFECRDMSERPWKASPFGTAYRIVSMDETPFRIVQSWVAENVAAVSRFVIIVKEQNPHVMRESIRIAKKDAIWCSSDDLDAPLAADKQATTKRQPPSTKPPSTPPAGNPGAASETVAVKDEAKEDASTLEKTTEDEQKGLNNVHSSLYIGKGLDCPQEMAAPCLEYVNRYVKMRGMHVDKIEDLRSGAVMVILIEQLTKKRAEPQYLNAANKNECIANWATVLRVLQERGCHIENDLPEDCYYGPQTTLVALVTLVAEHFAGNKQSMAVTDEVLTLLDKIQQKQEFIEKLSKELKEREDKIFQKEIELERREASLAARERQLEAAGVNIPHQPPTSPTGANPPTAGAQGDSRSQGTSSGAKMPTSAPKIVLPPPPAPMPAGYMKRIHSPTSLVPPELP